MTHIEAKAANLALGGPNETLSETEGALSPEALALFSSLFAQMQPKNDASKENMSQLSDSAVTSPVTSIATLNVSQQNSVGTKIVDAGAIGAGAIDAGAIGGGAIGAGAIDAGAIDAGAIDAGAIDLNDTANLTELLIAAQQIVGSGRIEAEAPATTTDKTIFSDAPMKETTAIATHLMRQAAVALIERKQLIEATEGSAPKTAYDSEALSNPQLKALIHAIMRPVLNGSVSGVPAIEAAATAEREAIIDFDPQVAVSAALNLPLADVVPNALQGPPQPSGQGPVPVQLANLVQGPPQKSGQGPAVPPVIKHLQGPPQASGQGPEMPKLGKQLQGPPQQSGQGPVTSEQVTHSQGPSHPSGQRLSPVQHPSAGFDRRAATPMMAQPVIEQRSTVGDAILLDEVAAEKLSKAEFSGKPGIKTEIEAAQRMPNGQRNDRIMKPVDVPLQTANSVAAKTMTMAHRGGTPSRSVTPPMTLDLSRQMVAEASTESNHQSQQSATTQQQSGQSGGNASGQQGRDAQQGIDPNTKNAGGERVAVYRLNVQQNGWADTMVRRLQTSLQNGTGAVRIVLEPRNLGRLQVNMGLRDGRATIRIAADTTQAASLLRDSRAQLAQMFEQSGLRLSNMQTTATIINGDGGGTGDGGGSHMFADQQTSGHNANKDGKNSEHSNKLLSDSADASDIEIDTTTALAPGETAVLNVLA